MMHYRISWIIFALDLLLNYTDTWLVKCAPLMTDLLAHLSRRLIGFAYSIPSKIFSKIALPIEALYHAAPSLEGGTNVYINDSGHMTKIVATPIYNKNV